MDDPLFKGERFGYIADECFADHSSAAISCSVSAALRRYPSSNIPSKGWNLFDS